ncbi:hypothetical protein SAMN05421788_11419 [Filimonas lacunae]|uniref:DUF5689 domain-containing protein n=1 Tax=Filimonas lacunae TaxID=477680 RepID=A0A173MLT1_9BACT|nr:DUF5689 domain-containing protein [Filimonas lacunae]BAV08436.1 hypothetical protein FLA_4477 [Filimonas lacunae]SIT33925.1 hypothetical protein SAMN05421788_11419 [Filimonas lacunae]
MKYQLWVACVCMLACNKPFDKPETYENPDITANISIKQLKTLHTVKGKFESITEDYIITGVVTADDRSGNFYKSIVIEDATGGISLVLSRAALYNDYPLGRRLFIKAKGLVLGDYRGLMQLGAGIDVSDPSDLAVAGIAAPLLSKYIIKGNLHNTVTPVIVTADKLTTALQDEYQNRLIQLQDVQFAAADSMATYANSVTRQAGSFTLQNCEESVITLRNSAYANFASAALPRGRGSVTGVYTVFNSAKQLMIRDTADVQCRGERCNKVQPVEEDVPYEQGIQLKGSGSVLFDCNRLDSIWPAGISLHTDVTAIDSGVVASFAATKASWAATTGGFKNYASATGLSVNSTQAQQQASVNRALGIRQVSATDKGVAFVLAVNNTLQCKNITLSFLLQSLDAASGRATTWVVDYAQGSYPTTYTPVITTPELLVTGKNSFTSTAVKVVLPEAVANSNKKLTIRIVALTATTGSGSRASTAIDDIKLEWN